MNRILRKRTRPMKLGCKMLSDEGGNCIDNAVNDWLKDKTIKITHTNMVESRYANGELVLTVLIFYKEYESGPVPK